MYTYTYTYMCMHMYTRISCVKDVDVDVSVDICMHCMHAYVYVCVYIYIYITERLYTCACIPLIETSCESRRFCAKSRLGCFICHPAQGHLHLLRHSHGGPAAMHEAMAEANMTALAQAVI